MLALTVFVSVCCSCVAEKTNKDKILLVASFYPVYIFTLNIVDDIPEFSVECMAEQNVGCLHDYQILSKDARLISDSDAFIINGAGMEEFLEDVYISVDDIKVIDSSKNVEVIEECHEEHHEADEHHHHSVNSHIWMSVKNAIVQCENIATELSQLYPQYKEEIDKNPAILSGWKVNHKYRCNTRGGDISLGEMIFIMDDEFQEIVTTYDVDDMPYAGYVEFIKKTLTETDKEALMSKIEELESDGIQ